MALVISLKYAFLLVGKKPYKQETSLKPLGVQEGMKEIGNCII